MIYLVAFASTILTGGFVAIMARLAGTQQMGLLIAIAVLAGGAQLLVLMLWYLFHTKADLPAREESGARVGAEDVSL